jgi:5-methylthioadenosine/S-adenosylhomocysteine deaminase
MPLSNCEVGGGIAPVPQLLAKQVTLGLGSDGYIDDFFEIMRGAFLIHKAAHLDPGVMPAREVWYLATEGGARTLGLEKIGKVQTGWIADLQLIDGNLPTPLEAHNFFDQLLLYRNSSHVKSVMVNGQFIMKNSVIPDLDAEKLTADVHQEAKRLWSYTAK